MFEADPQNPGYGYITQPDGLVGYGAAPSATPAAPSMPSGSTEMPPRAAAVLAKRDAVLPPGNGLALAGTTSSRSVQKGLAPEVLDPILASNTASAEASAAGVEEAGRLKSDRAAQTAMGNSAASYGRYTTSEADRRQAKQNAEISRLNEMALTAQKDPDVDPDKFISSMSTGKKIGMTILAALNGAFKGMVGQQGNDVMDILDQRVKQDIDAQKEQIASGRLRRGNMIAYFRDQGMRLESAEKAAEAMSYAMLDRMQQSEAERINSPEALEQSKLLGNQIRAQAEQRNNDLKLQLGTDRVTTQSSETRARPAAAGPQDLLKIVRDKKLLRQELKDNYMSGGMSEQDAEAAMRQYDEKGITISGKTTAQAAKDLETQFKNQKDLDTRRRQYSVEDRELADEETAMAASAQALGGSYDKATGELTLPDDLTGFGAGAFVSNIPGSEAKAAREAIVNLTDVKQRYRSGAAAPVAEVENFKKMTSGDNFYGLDEESVKNAMLTSAASLQARRQAAMLGAGEDVLADWERQKQSLPTAIESEDR